MPDTTISVLAYKYIWVPMLAILGKMFMDETWKNNFNKRIEKVETRVTVAESTIVTDERIRAIIEETERNLKEKYSDLRVDFKEVAENVIELRLDFATASAVSEERHSQ